MADELELLRRANPVPTDGPDFGEGPLDRRAEERLRRLLRENRPRRRVRLLPVLPGRTPRARLAWGLAATTVVLAIAVNAVLGGSSTPRAVAAPGPLTVHVHSTSVPLKQLVALADAAASGGSPGLRKGTHVQSWSLGMSDDKPPVTVPEERVVRWRADASHTELVVATDPRRPGRPVLTDEGNDPHEVADGQVISRTTYPPMWSDAPPEGTPPHTAAGLRAYLTETVRPEIDRSTAPLTTAELLDAVGELLDHWTLGARESAALVRLFAEAKGLRPAGEVTDRLGRPGHAYVYDTGGIRHMLILEPRTGAVLGMENTFTEDAPEYGVKAGDVMGYSAWMR
ncbi:CU044_5270 family protein [Streptomyces sp. NPDC005728]|uniref:CU044_5270 family protein n=1 Tax=Streptomyces sp. NPDC005728 TaxID=3157054 RepID=UPI0033F38243